MFSVTGACEYPKRTHVYKSFSFYRRWYASTKTKFSTMYNKLLTVNQIYTRVKIRAWNSSTKNFEYFLSIAPREAKKKIQNRAHFMMELLYGATKNNSHFQHYSSASFSLPNRNSTDRQVWTKNQTEYVKNFKKRERTPTTSRRPK